MFLNPILAPSSKCPTFLSLQVAAQADTNGASDRHYVKGEEILNKKRPRDRSSCDVEAKVLGAGGFRAFLSPLGQREVEDGERK